MSKFLADIDSMLSYRETLGFSSRAYNSHLKNFDRFCTVRYPLSESLTVEIVHEWLKEQSQGKRNGLRGKTDAIRHLGKYIAASGKEAYILPKGFVSDKSTFTPYIFNDSELRSFFDGVDALKSNHYNPFASEIVPVLFRLLYTCGLRPNEGRELKRTNINFNTGEVLIVHNKRKKQRIVVMSDVMLEMCSQYDRQRTIFAENSEYFFPARNGMPYKTKMLTSLMKQCWRLGNSNIPSDELPNVRPYDLRHRFASAVLHKWLDEGKNLFAMLPYLRAYMGHDDFESTAYYIHLLPENLLKSAGINWKSLSAVLPEVEA